MPDSGVPLEFDDSIFTKTVTDSPTENQPESRVGLRIKYLSDVQAKQQTYLWEPYIPSDQLIGLYGPSHTAKSIIALDWAARITTAAQWPDGSQNTLGPRKVLMLAAGEDAIETVLKPRFVLAGGDPGRRV
jgi:hypothetical protein